MKDGDNNETAGSDAGVHGLRGHKPALQVICLGDSGGPCEDFVTGFLVRSVANGWFRGSLLAVDAGSHLAPICRILERDFPKVSAGAAQVRRNGSLVSNGNGKNGPRASLSPSPLSDDDEPQLPEPTVLRSGPFAGLSLPHASARANAAHIFTSYISAYLITHPHLDHLSGFVVNTAALHQSAKPKTLAALPSTVNAVRQHIFNDVIWPNLTDEDGGVGFVTFQRLKEGGDVMVGEGEGRGYIDVVEGLGVRAFKVSHGVCAGRPNNHRRRSIAPVQDQQGSIGGETAQPMGRSLSTSQQYSTPGTPGAQARQSSSMGQISPSLHPLDTEGVIDSTAYFIRDSTAQREVLIFGDVEPDTLSKVPRNRIVWQEAARKIAHNLLGGIFIECSYADSQEDQYLFGHLAPRFLIEELQVLAGLVVEAKMQRALDRSVKKRKRSGLNGIETAAQHAVSEVDRKRSRSVVARAMPRDARRSSVPDYHMTDTSMTTSPSIEHVNPMEQQYAVKDISPRSVSFGDRANAPGYAAYDPHGGKCPLSDIKVVIIHVKDTLKDGPHVSELILAELEQHEVRLTERGQALGCEFVISKSGESYWF